MREHKEPWRCIRRNAHWRQLANTTERPVRGGLASDCFGALVFCSQNSSEITRKPAPASGANSSISAPRETAVFQTLRRLCLPGHLPRLPCLSALHTCAGKRNCYIVRRRVLVPTSTLSRCHKGQSIYAFARRNSKKPNRFYLAPAVRVDDGVELWFSLMLNRKKSGSRLRDNDGSDCPVVIWRYFANTVVDHQNSLQQCYNSQ